MDKIFSEIMNRGQIPKTQDIADLLASIAPVGKKRDEKLSTVTRLFQELGMTAANLQGHSLLDTLETYEAY